MRTRAHMADLAKTDFGDWQRFQAIKWRWQLVAALQYVRTR